MSDIWEFPKSTHLPLGDYDYDDTTATPFVPYAMDDAGPDFRCERCIHHEGGCKCDLNIFIYAVGVDMSACWGFEEGVICRHCGRITQG